MTIEEAIKHGQEQLEIFGGTHKEFIKLAIKALEQESVIDKIRAEIKARLCDVVSDYTDGYRTAIQGDLAIIDKYKAGTEET